MKSKRVLSLAVALTVAVGLIFSLAPGAFAASIELDEIYAQYGRGEIISIHGSADIAMMMVYLIDPGDNLKIASTLTVYDLLSGYNIYVGSDWELGSYTLRVGYASEVMNEYHIEIVEEPVDHKPERPDKTGGNRVVATGISLSPARITVESGKSATVEVVTEGTSVRWETDDNDKISISGTTTATVTGLKTGTATAWAYSGNNYATLTVEILPADKSSGGQDVAQQNQTEPEKQPEPETLPDVFNDMDGAAWAKESVNALAAAGIVNGIGDGAFAPSRSVTRAEFVKMVVGAFHFEPVGETIKFDDVAAGEWYADVVSIAAQNRIVNGYAGRFSPDDNISCQDAALILSRVAEMKGIALPLPAAAETEAVEYAREAVALLKGNGVITPEMNFSAEEQATRAQSAYMIYQIYRLGGGNG